MFIFDYTDIVQDVFDKKIDWDCKRRAKQAKEM